jgi:Fic family protein
LAEAKQEIGLLEGIGRSLPNSEILLRPLQNREAIRSSSLEGTYATPEQLLLLEPDTEKADGGAASAVRELIVHSNALSQVGECRQIRRSAQFRS